MSGDWTGKGYDNIVATEAGFNSSGMTGRMETTFGDDGKMAQARFSGTYNGADATVVYDGNGNIIREQSTSGFNRSHEEVISNRVANIKTVEDIDTYTKTTGSQITHNDTVSYNVGKPVQIGNASIENMLRGNVDASIGNLMFSDKAIGQAIVSQQAAAMGGKLGADLGANASDSEVINMIPVSYQAKFAEISAMDISIADKTAMWNDFSAGVMGTVTHDSEETKMERLGKVVDENIEGATEWFDKNFSPEAVMERLDKQAETDPMMAEFMKNGGNRF